MRRTVTPVRVVLCALISIALATPAFAQFRAGVQGTLQDPSGAVVPNAKVTATNQQTGVSKSSVSTGTGFYRIDFLPPGAYTVRVDAAGFQAAPRTVNVGGDAFTSVDISLKPQASGENVTVSSEVNGVQTENANVNQTITSTQVEQLPAFGRDPYELLRLAPGVFGDSSRAASGNAVFLPNAVGPGGSNSSIFQTENQVQVSGNGQRTSANSYEIDGVNVNSLNWGGAAVVTPNMESIKEVNVTSSTYSAEDGRNTGVQTKIVSQTGTNSFHGSALFKYDDPNFNTAPKWGGQGGAKAFPVSNNYRDYAASVGGPILKDKLFFFLSYEGAHQTATNYTTGYYITPQYLNMVQTLRTGTPIGTIFGAGGLQAKLIQDLTPSQGCKNFGAPDTVTNTANCHNVPGGLDLGSPTGTYGSYVPIGSIGGGFDGVPDIGYGQFALPNRSNANQFNGRLDYNMGRTTFAASSYITKLSSVSSDGSSNGMSQADVNLKPLNMLFTLLGNTTISPTLLNEARFNVSRFAFNQVQSNPQADWGIPHLQVEGLPIPRFQMAAPWATTTPGIFAQNQFEFRDIISKVMGNQGLKFGVEYRKEQNNNNELGGARPFYSFSGLWNLANGTPIFEQLDASPVNGGPASGQVYLRTHNIALFGQDDWRLRHNLTVNLGLRWEYFSPLTEANGQLYNINIPNDGNGLANAKMVHNGSIYPADHNNFGPRLGFAWSPDMFKDKMVVRGGFGVGYDRLPSAIYGNMARNPPNFSFFGLCCGTASTDFGTPFAGGQIQFYLGNSSSPASYPANTAIGHGVNANGFPNVGAVEVYAAAPDTATPYVYNYSLGTEYQLPWKLVAAVGYEGSSSHKLLRLIPGHLVIPQSAAQQNPSISALYIARTDVTGNYNSLNLNLRRSFSTGVQVTFKYRWSKTMDELSNEGPGFSTNQTWPQNDSLEYGPSDYDATHYVTASALYRLPFYKNRGGVLGNVLGGWEVSGIYSFHTGFPWTPVSYYHCYALPSTQAICPTRPVAYVGGAGTSNDTNTFITTGNFPGNLTGVGTNPSAYFNVCATCTNATQQPPGVGRNSFRGPRYADLDMTVGKSFSLPFREKSLLDLRMNLFNVTNHLNAAPFGFASPSTNIGDGNFGKATAPLAGRVMELQARFTF